MSPMYECTQDEFIENLSKIGKNIEGLVVHKKVSQIWLHWSDMLNTYPEIKEICRSIGLDGTFNSDFRHCLIDKKRGQGVDTHYIVYVVEHSFTWNGNTYVHRFNVYPKLKIHERPVITLQKTLLGTRKPISGKLVFEFEPPDPELYDLPLPKNVDILKGKLASAA